MSEEISFWSGLVEVVKWVCGTVLALAAFFKEDVRRAFLRVKFRLEWEADEPCLSQYSGWDDQERPEQSVYLRLKLYNTSGVDAEKVQMFVQSCERKVGGEWRKESQFVPMRLLWAHINVPVNDLVTGGTMHLCNFARWRSVMKEDVRGGRRLELLLEVSGYQGNFLGPDRDDWANADYAKISLEYRFQILSACKGGVVYKACWHLQYEENWEPGVQESKHPKLTLRECKPMQVEQSRWPWG